MKKFLLALSILALPALSIAQTKVIVKQKSNPASATGKTPYPPQNYSTQAPVSTATPAAPAISAPSGQSSASTTAAAAPAPTPIAWKLSYFGEYVGPRLTNFDLQKSQGPEDPAYGYTTIDHSLKVGYAVSAENILGVRFRGSNVLDPTVPQQFQFANLRIYGTWSNIADTDYFNLSQVLETELPTTDKAKTAGLIVRFNINTNWTIKTALRNWSFSFVTILSPRFFDGKNGNTLYVALCPTISLDLAPDLSMVIEGSFDADRDQNLTFFDFTSSDPDNVNLGVNWQINPHLGVNPAMRFFTYDPSPQTAVVYLGVSASL